MDRWFQVLALRDDMPLAEAGLLHRALRWADNEKVFWILHYVLNTGPWSVATFVCAGFARASRLLLMNPKAWDARHKTASSLRKMCGLPAQYLPFTSPAAAWLFQSNLRLPSNWDPMEYSLLVYRGATAFANSDLKAGPSRNSAATFR